MPEVDLMWDAAIMGTCRGDGNDGLPHDWTYGKHHGGIPRIAYCRACRLKLDWRQDNNGDGDWFVAEAPKTTTELLEDLGVFEREVRA